MPDTIDIPMHARKKGEERDAELRGMVPTTLLQLIDAVMQAKGLENRMDVVIPVMERYVREELHAASLLCRMAGINPLQSEPAGARSETRA